jgi:hypothetical protein
MTFSISKYQNVLRRFVVHPLGLFAPTPKPQVVVMYRVGLRQDIVPTVWHGSGNLKTRLVYQPCLSQPGTLVTTTSEWAFCV